jgi:hypothetical protein
MAKNYGADLILVGGLTLFAEGKETLSQPRCDILKQYFAPPVQKRSYILDISICICSEGANNSCPE